MKPKRNWLPCRECGKEHQNPASSSCCARCNERLRAEGAKQAQWEADLKKEMEAEQLTTAQALDEALETIFDLALAIHEAHRFEDGHVSFLTVKPVLDRVVSIRKNHEHNLY